VKTIQLVAGKLFFEGFGDKHLPVLTIVVIVIVLRFLGVM
jgi:hypothetical protein